jgi:hypothetical protein
MSRSAICEWCGKVFVAKYGTEKLCSLECRAEDKELSAAARTRRGKGGNHRPRSVKRCPVHGCLIETRECLTCRAEAMGKVKSR